MKINSCPHTYRPIKLPFNRSPSSKFAFRSKADVAEDDPGYDAGHEWQYWMDPSWDGGLGREHVFWYGSRIRF